MRYTASDFGTGVPDMAIANAPNAIAPEIAPRIAPYSPTLKEGLHNSRTGVLMC